MTDRTDLDVIWIGAPPVLHAPVTISALKSGKHVFCQARMAMTLKEGRAMLAAAQARPELVSMLCPPKVGMKGGRYFNKLLIDGYPGELLHFDLRVHSDLFADARAPAHWPQRAEVCGINALSIGVYAEILNGWLGLPRRLQALTKVAVPVRCGYRVEVPDVIQVIGEWSNGLFGTLEWSAVGHFPPDATGCTAAMAPWFTTLRRTRFLARAAAMAAFASCQSLLYMTLLGRWKRISSMLYGVVKIRRRVLASE